METVNRCLHFSTVLGAVIKCKQYSEITVDSGIHLKRVKITLNTFAVKFNFNSNGPARDPKKPPHVLMALVSQQIFDPGNFQLKLQP